MSSIHEMPEDPSSEELSCNWPDVLLDLTCPPYVFFSLLYVLDITVTIVCCHTSKTFSDAPFHTFPLFIFM
jgi:hypothetical protein